MDLFDAAAEKALDERAPLAARLRPRSLDEVVGQTHLLGEGAPLRALIAADRLGSVILWGPPGTGKTTIARLVAGLTRREFVPLSAVTAGVKDVREVTEGARRRLGEQARGTILFLDEIHRFNRAQQDALLGAVEDGLLWLIGATTENPFFEVNAPLLSRSTLFRLEALTAEQVGALLDRALGEPRGLDGRAKLAADARVLVAERANGDARLALNTLETAAALAEAAGRDEILVEDAAAAQDIRVIPYDKAGDHHYDVASAFIKSLRGSDPDAALHWLARMLRGGEDPRFVARRMVIFASEDVGMADFRALLVAVAAQQALDLVGLPEARLNLAHAAIYLATAPKSNKVITAVDAALADVDALRTGEVPGHLRDASYPGAGRLGHGEGYRYPPADPDAAAAQQYLPDELSGRKYWDT